MIRWNRIHHIWCLWSHVYRDTDKYAIKNISNRQGKINWDQSKRRWNHMIEKATYKNQPTKTPAKLLRSSHKEKINKVYIKPNMTPNHRNKERDLVNELKRETSKMMVTTVTRKPRNEYKVGLQGAKWSHDEGHLLECKGKSENRRKRIKLIQTRC